MSNSTLQQRKSKVIARGQGNVYQTYVERAKGSEIWDVDGNEYIDYLCAYGPIIIGNREDEIDDEVIRQIKDKGFCFASLRQHPQYSKLLAAVP